MSKKFLTTAAGIVLTIALIAVWFSIANKGKTGINESVSQFDSLMSQYSDMQLSLYDDATVSGSEIITLIKALSLESHYTIHVKNGSGKEKSYTYELITANDSSMLKDMVDKKKEENYINPSASFKSSVTYNENGIISDITFEQKK